MAKQTITTVAIGNCGASSNYNDEERERHKNIMKLMDKKEQRTANSDYTLPVLLRRAKTCMKGGSPRVPPCAGRPLLPRTSMPRPGILAEAHEYREDTN